MIDELTTGVANAKILVARDDTTVDLKLKSWSDLKMTEAAIRPDSLATLMIPGTTGFFCLRKYLEEACPEDPHLELLNAIDSFRNTPPEGSGMTDKAVYIIDNLLGCNPKLAISVKERDELNTKLLAKNSKAKKRFQNLVRTIIDQKKAENAAPTEDSAPVAASGDIELEMVPPQESEEPAVAEAQEGESPQVEDPAAAPPGPPGEEDEAVEEKNEESDRPRTTSQLVREEAAESGFVVQLSSADEAEEELKVMAPEPLPNNRLTMMIQSWRKDAKVPDFKFTNSLVEELNLTEKLRTLAQWIIKGTMSSALFDFLVPLLANKVTKHYEGFLESAPYKRWVGVAEVMNRPVGYHSFSFFRVLGRGAFGAVWAVRKNDTGNVMALKEMKKHVIQRKGAERQVMRERDVLASVENPFVLRLKYSFQTTSELYLCFDICEGGDLSYWLHIQRDVQAKAAEERKALQKQLANAKMPSGGGQQRTSVKSGGGGGFGLKKRFSKQSMTQEQMDAMNAPLPLPGFDEEKAKFYAAEVLLGLEALHAKGWIYRDLKPANVLLKLSGHIVLSDMGMCRKLVEGKRICAQAGTAGYWAPEVVREYDTTEKSDVWSWGCLLYCMIQGRLPRCDCAKFSNEWCSFEREDREENFDRNICEARVPEAYSSVFSKDCADLLKHVFVTDMKERYSIDDIKKHPFFESINWKLLAQEALYPPFIPSSSEIHAEDGDEGDEPDDGNQEEGKQWPGFEFSSNKVMEEEFAKCLATLEEQGIDPEQATVVESGCGCVLL